MHKRVKRRLLLRALCESIAKGERPAVYGELDRSIYPAGYEGIISLAALPPPLFAGGRKKYTAVVKVRHSRALLPEVIGKSE